jgi:hypothetical protein
MATPLGARTRGRVAFPVTIASRPGECFEHSLIVERRNEGISVMITIMSG